MKINRVKMLDVIEKLKPGLSQKMIIEQMSHCIFTGSDVVTFNDLNCIFCQFETDFSCSVPADELQKVLSRITEDEMEVKLDNGILSFETKNTILQLSTRVEDDLTPKIDAIMEEVNEGEWVKIPDSFVEGAYLCMFSASRDLASHLSTAAYVNGKTIVCGENYRVSQFFMEEEMPEFMIRATVIGELKKYKITHYKRGKAWVFFLTEDETIFATKQIKGAYNQDLVALFKSHKGISFILPVELLDTVDTVAVMSKGDSVPAKEMEVIVDNAGLGSRITCKAQKDIGKISSSVQVATHIPDISFVTNPVFLSEVLKRAKTIGKEVSACASNNILYIQTGAFHHLLALSKNHKES